MNIQNFYKQCDSIINQWISNNNALLNNDPFLNKQKPKKGLLKKKYFDTMPEPFWGDPDHCSIVMINLNPAYKEGHDKLFSREKTQTLCPNGYSDFAKSFPILNEDSYNPEGKEWWEGRKKYLDQLVQDYPNKEKISDNNLRPFAIEVCPWQSSTWADAKVKMEDGDLKKHINEYVIEPALYAIDHSQVDFAVAIGKPILDALLECGFRVMKSWGPNTDDPKYLADNILPDNYPTTLKKGDTEETPANVFFKLLVKEEEGGREGREGREKGRLIKVLCIKKDGSNHVPGPQYRKNGIEQKILDYIASV